MGDTDEGVGFKLWGAGPKEEFPYKGGVLKLF